MEPKARNAIPWTFHLYFCAQLRALPLQTLAKFFVRSFSRSLRGTPPTNSRFPGIGMASSSASALSLVGDLAEFLLFFCCLRLNGTRGDESVELLDGESAEPYEDSVSTSKASFSPSESEFKSTSAYDLLSLPLLFVVVMVVL